MDTLLDLSDRLYLDVADLAHATPHWFQLLAEVWTEAGLLLFGVLFLAGWWRTRDGSSRAMALALLAPLATAFGYVVSESLKSLIDEERPCRAVAGAPASLVTCPPYGDWSFPSNHSAIAGAAAIALALSWRGMGRFTVPMAMLMAASRVFVGVHYPHDVTAGLLLGGLVAFLVLRFAEPPVRSLVETARSSRNTLVVWCAGQGPRTAAPAAAPSSSLFEPAPAQGSAPAYGAPAPSYDAPAPSYENPAPGYGAPTAYGSAPSYDPTAYGSTPSYDPSAPYGSVPAHDPSAPHGSAAPQGSAYPYGNPASPYGDPSAPYGNPVSPYGDPAPSYENPAAPYEAPAPPYSTDPGAPPSGQGRRGPYDAH